MNCSGSALPTAWSAAFSAVTTSATLKRSREPLSASTSTRDTLERGRYGTALQEAITAECSGNYKRLAIAWFTLPDTLAEPSAPVELPDPIPEEENAPPTEQHFEPPSENPCPLLKHSSVIIVRCQWSMLT